MGWPDKMAYEKSGSWFCVGPVRVHKNRLAHLSTHDFQLPSRLGVQEHGIWQLPQKVVATHGNLTIFRMSLAYAVYAKFKSTRDVVSVKIQSQGAKPRLVMCARVLGDDDEPNSLGYSQRPGAIGGHITALSLQHVVCVFEIQNGYLNLITMYPVRV